MKKILAAGVALAALSTVSAFAADLPSRKSAEAPAFAPPLFTWTGFYVGLNAGAAFGNSSNSNGLSPSGNFLNPGLFPAANVAPLGLLGTGGSNNNARFAGGGQIGYNYQVGQLVFGIEADLDFITRGSRGNGNGAVVLPVALGGIGATTAFSTRSGNNGGNYFGTVRPRIGFAIDRALIYVTGGLAYGDFTNRRSSTVAFRDATGAVLNTFSSTGGGSNRLGYALGGGVEYAITNNWTVRGEYLYIGNSRKNNATLVSPTAPGFVFNSGGGSNRGFSVVRAAVNYKF